MLYKFKSVVVSLKFISRVLFPRNFDYKFEVISNKMVEEKVFDAKH